MLCGLLIAACLLATAAPALAQGRDVLAHGLRLGNNPANVTFWVVLVDSKGAADSSSLLVRERFGEKEWLALPAVMTRIVALTSQSSESVVLLRDAKGRTREWAWWSPSRFSYGPSLPDHADILAMAGDQRSLWALGPPAAAATTASTATTQAASLTTRPARPVLYRFTGDSWQAQSADWPADISYASGEGVSMAIVADKPTLAVGGDDAIDIIQFDHDVWTALEQIKSPGPVQFKLLAMSGQPALWLQPKGGEEVGAFRVLGRSPIKLATPNPAPRAADADLTTAGDMIRLFYRRKDAVVEQRYNDDGSLAPPVEVKLRKPPGEDQFSNWLFIGIGAVLMIIILNFVLRRRAARGEDDDADEDE